MALVDQVFDLQATERDAFAGFTDMGDGFFDRLFPKRSRRILLREGFEGAGDDLFGRIVAAREEVGRDELLAAWVES
jgi:hypothetical protein